MLDKEIRSEQIQAIHNADGVAALFAELGYRTEARIAQTADVLGITPESSANQIKKIERIADQDGLLQVYLFEVASLTQALTHTIARAFRNRAGQYLLVLTADYDRLDFVLIERLLSSSKTETLVPKQVTLRPRVASIARQNPGRVHLRLLRRLTYTESDPEYQFEKLRSAFDMAEWSEEFFNNRGLFSDYYLIERVPESAAWKEDPRPAHRRLSELLSKASERWAGKPKAEICAGLIQPALDALGFAMTAACISTKDSPQPDYLLALPSAPGSPVALCLIYPWGRWLDGKDDRRDAVSPDENPGARVVSLLESGTARWAILTNGKVWRLYSGKAHSRATNYYEIDLDETLAQRGPQGNDAAEAFRYFWLIFRAKAFDSRPSFLDDILAGSEAYAKKLGDRLKERIFEEIFPIFAEGFIAHIRQRDGKRADLSQPALDHIFQGTLTVLYRLLFILYAEARDLLPVKEYHGYGQKSLKLIKEEIADKGADLEGARDEKLSTDYSATEDSLYRRLMALCAVIDKGDRALNVPMYNGGLFMTEPPEDDTSLEAGNARFIRDHVIPDRWLARGLDRLARDVDDKSHALVFIDYKSLGVRHLGSIYEGLLEFKLRVAAEKMAVVEGKKADEIVPYREAQQEKRKTLKAGRGKDAVERVLAPGTVYLENDRRERKATGSYYTPDYIVQYIVEHAVGPVLDEKFAALTPKLRDAQKALKQERDKAAALKKTVGKHDDPEHEAYLKHRQVVDDLFDVKVLDPAMGSGHFLVEAVDFTTDRLLHFLNGFPWNPVLAHLKETRETILQEMERQGISIDAGRLSDVNLLKRHVLKRCIYGVDLNPMAVELAKVSLWLDCFTLGAPLSFLDHHLKCGNSLIGANVDEVREAIEKGQLSLLSGRHFETLMFATDLMQHVGELSDVTAEQVKESRREYRKASDALAPFMRMLDVYTSQWFGNETRIMGKGKARRGVNLALEFLRTKESETWAQNPHKTELPQEWQTIVATTTKAASGKRFFHWELEFPEVFFARLAGTTHMEKKPNAGFDAVVGNPPYVRQETALSDRDFCKEHFGVFHGNADLYVYFLETACRTLAVGRNFGLIVGNRFFRSEYGKPLRTYLLEHAMLTHVIDFRDLPVFEGATAYPCILIARRGLQGSHSRVLAGEPTGLGQEAIYSCLHEFDNEQFSSGEWTITASGRDLVDRIQSVSLPLNDLLTSQNLTMARGVETGANEVFVVSRAKWEDFIRKDPASKRMLAPLVRGTDLVRWETPASEDRLILAFDKDVLKSDPIAAYLKSNRAKLESRTETHSWMAFRRVHSHPDHLIASKIIFPDISIEPAFTLDKDGVVPLNTSFYIDTTDLFILTILNSRVSSFCMGKIGARLRGGYFRFIPSYVGRLPLRRIHFTTPKAERKAQTQKLVGLYESDRFDDLLQEIERLLPKDKDGAFLAFKPSATGAEEKSDVVHDLLAHLADLMMTLNKQKQAEMKRFLGWLETRLKITPDKDDEAGLDSLTGKTTLKGYLGDYQKGKDAEPFAAIVEVLRKNRTRLGISLSDKATLDKIETEYQNSLTKLIPIKDRLARTDRLIDQVVYKLYGLGMDEIKIVGGN